MMHFACPGCGKKLEIPDALADKMVRCPNCIQPVKVPTAAVPVRPTGDVSLLTPGQPGRGFTLQSDDAGNKASLVPPGAPARGFTLESDPRPGAPGPEPEKPSDQELVDFLAPAQGPGELGRLGRYRVLKVLGVGGMGVVFQAEDTQLRRAVALKAMLPALAASAAGRRRFQREAQAAAAIEHEHIITVYDIGEERHIPFLAMPLLQGETLEDRLQRPPRLALAETVRLGREIALGLAAAHQRGLMHRDVKPANVWLEGPGARVEILDFGLARALDDEAHLTRTGGLLGTPAYMAPEQAAGGKVDQRGDLFSLGCILYQLCTGQPAFTGSTPLLVVSAVATREPRPVEEVNPAVPPALALLVRRLLAKRPEERPGSAREVAEALAALGSALPAASGLGFTLVLDPAPPATALPAAAGPPATRASRTPLGWILVGAGSLLAGMVVLGLIWRGGGSAPPAGEKAGPGNTRNKPGGPDDGDRKLAAAQQAAAKAHAAARRLAEQEFDFAGAVRELERVPEALRDRALYEAFKAKRDRVAQLEADIRQAGRAERWEELRAKIQALLTLQPNRPDLLARLKKLPRETIIKNSLGMEFVWCPPGEFQMGSAKNEAGRDPGETRHKVTLTRGFYLARHLLTQKQWQEVMGYNPSQFQRDDQPVERVSWDDCQEFCKRLGAKDGRQYRLPTEAEWEYACRAGTRTAYYFGDDPGELGDYAWFAGNAGGCPHPVGQKKPNAWKLYDMHGNVGQWCQDRYGAYGSDDIKDPLGPSEGTDRVIRGGSCIAEARICRAAFRGPGVPETRYWVQGCRLALVPSGK